MRHNKTGNKSISFQTKRKSHLSKEGYRTKNDGLCNAGGQILVKVASQFIFPNLEFQEMFFKISIFHRMKDEKVITKM